MPNVHLYKPSTESILAVWRVEEGLDFFKSHTTLYKAERRESEGYRSGRLLEWYAGRYLLQQFLPVNNRPPCLKDRYGKPHLLGTHLEISMSHSHDLVAVALAKISCGIDIQLLTGKIRNIRHKFISDTELQSMQNPESLIAMHVYWGAKECIYKAHGKKKLDFRRNMSINPFNTDKQYGQTIGLLSTKTEQAAFKIEWNLIQNKYLLVYASLLD